MIPTPFKIKRNSYLQKFRTGEENHPQQGPQALVLDGRAG